MLPFYSIHYITNNKMKYEWNIRMPIQDGTAASTTKWATNAFRMKLFLKWDTILASWPFSIHDVIRRWHNMPPTFSNLFWIKRNGQNFFITRLVTSITAGYHADKTFHSSLNEKLCFHIKIWIRCMKKIIIKCFIAIGLIWLLRCINLNCILFFNSFKSIMPLKK